MNVAPILVSGQYLLVSGGDDAALYAAEFNLKHNKNDVTKVHVTREVSEPSAHTSSVTGNCGSTIVFRVLSLLLRERKRETLAMRLIVDHLNLFLDPFLRVRFLTNVVV